MCRKLLSLALALVICLGLTLPAFAAESEWKLAVPGKSDAEAFTSGKTFILRDCGFFDYDTTGAIHLYKGDDLQWTAENMCVLAKGDTAVFTYKPEVYTGGGGFTGGSFGSQSFSLIAWTDPDGDGVYDKRLIMEDEYDYTNGEDGHYEFLLEDWEILPAGIDVSNGDFGFPISSRHCMVNPDKDGYEMRLSADRVLKVFGPNTLVWIYAGDGTQPLDSDWAILVEGETAQTQQPAVPETPSGTAVAAPTNDRLTVNGKAAEPTVYKIDGSNYFKLRDVAALLNGTEKQFAVGYDNTNKSAAATTGQGYTKQAGDLAGAAAGGSQTAVVSNDSIYVDGEKIDAQVYKIGGSNYFKLRDLGKALNFYVGWSKEQGMFIETDKPYHE